MFIRKEPTANKTRQNNKLSVPTYGTVFTPFHSPLFMVTDDRYRSGGRLHVRLCVCHFVCRQNIVLVNHTSKRKMAQNTAIPSNKETMKKQMQIVYNGHIIKPIFHIKNILPHSLNIQPISHIQNILSHRRIIQPIRNIQNILSHRHIIQPISHVKIVHVTDTLPNQLTITKIFHLRHFKTNQLTIHRISYCLY